MKSWRENRVFVLACLAAVVLLGLPAVPVLAQQPADSEQSDQGLFALSLEALSSIEISSASKQLEQASQAPASLTVITREEIAQFGFVTLEELIEHLPGIYFVDTYEDILIGTRGTVGGGVQFLINGIPRHPSRIKALTVPERQRFNIPIEAIDRIELVRGPKSVIYGNNAFLGSVNIITNDIDSAGSSVTGGYGTRQTGKGAWRLSHRFSDDAYIITNGWYYQTQGIDGDLYDTMSDEQLAALDPQMKTELDGLLPQKKFSAEFYGNYKGLWTDLIFRQMNYGFYGFTPSFDEGNRLELVTLQLSVGYTRKLKNEVELKSYLLYSRETYYLHPDFVVPDVQGFQDEASNRIEAELSISTPLWRQATLLAGYNLQVIFGARNQVEFSAPDLDADVESEAVWRNDLFLKLDQRLFKRLTLSAGVRFSVLAPYSVDQVIGPLSDPSLAQDTTYNYASGGRLDVVPRGSIVYKFNDHHALKAVYSMAIQNNREKTIDEPERIQSVELIYWLAYQRLSGQLSVFFQRTDRLFRIVQQYDEASGDYVRQVDNSGSLRTFGGELELRATPVHGLQLLGSVSVQFTEDLNNPEIAVGDSPTWLAKAMAAYSLPLPKNHRLVLALLGHFVDGMKTDWQWTDQADQWVRIGSDVPPYFLLGANLQYRYEPIGFTVNIHGANLLDWDVRYPANELVQFDGGGFGQGRTVFGSAGFSW